MGMLIREAEFLLEASKVCRLVYTPYSQSLQAANHEQQAICCTRGYIEAGGRPCKYMQQGIVAPLTTQLCPRLLLSLAHLFEVWAPAPPVSGCLLVEVPNGAHAVNRRVRYLSHIRTLPHFASRHCFVSTNSRLFTGLKPSRHIPRDWS